MWGAYWGRGRGLGGLFGRGVRGVLKALRPVCKMNHSACFGSYNNLFTQEGLKRKKDGFNRRRDPRCLSRSTDESPDEFGYSCACQPNGSIWAVSG